MASEFRRRLDYYGGRLGALRIERGRVVAEWESQKCRFLDGEVTDLAIAVIRGYRGRVEAVEIGRTCGDDTVRRMIAGEVFERYRAGEIGDAELLKEIH